MLKPIKRAVVRANRRLARRGVDLLRFQHSFSLSRQYRRDLDHFRSLCRDNGLPEPEDRHLKAMLFDRDEGAGTVDPHYFAMDIWAAQRVFELAPRTHIDVGSRIDGFISHLLVFREVTVWDIRPLPAPVPGVTFVQADATNLAGVADDSVESLSSLHAIEHFGLGRYGDPLDPLACDKAMRSFVRVLAPGGRLLLALPIGSTHVEFNGQRVLDPRHVIETCKPLELIEFSAIADKGTLYRGADPGAFRDERGACGLFEFTKRIS